MYSGTGTGTVIIPSTTGSPYQKVEDNDPTLSSLDEHTIITFPSGSSRDVYLAKMGTSQTIPFLKKTGENSGATQHDAFDMGALQNTLIQNAGNLTDKDMSQLSDMINARAKNGPIKSALSTYAGEPDSNTTRKARQREGLINLAKEALGKLEEHRKASITCHGTGKEIAKIAAETIGFSSLCILATINLLGITGDADFSKPMEAFDKLMSLPAAISTGSMYTGAAVVVYQKLLNWIRDNFPDGTNHLSNFKEAIASTWKGTSTSEIIKSLVVLPVAVWSVILDARNTKVGTYDLLKKGLSEGAAQRLSTFLAFGNGFAEALLPLVTLPQLFDTIAAPLKGMIYGSKYTEANLEEFKQLITKLATDSEDNSLKNANDLSNHINKHIQGLSHTERANLHGALSKITDNTANFHEEFEKYLEGEPIHSRKTQLKSFATLLLQFSTMTLTMWTIGSLVSANQKVTYYSGELAQRNITGEMLSNMTLSDEYPNLAAQLGIEPFDKGTDILNVGSYACQGFALYSYVLFSSEWMLEVFKAFLPETHSKLLDKDTLAQTNVRRFLIALGCAVVGAGSYAYKLVGAASLGEILRDMEDSLGIDTSLLPAFRGMMSIAIALIVTTLVGGAYNGAQTLCKWFPISLCCRNAEPIEDDISLASISDGVASENPQEMEKMLSEDQPHQSSGRFKHHTPAPDYTKTATLSFDRRIDAKFPPPHIESTPAPESDDTASSLSSDNNDTGGSQASFEEDLVDVPKKIRQRYKGQTMSMTTNI